MESHSLLQGIFPNQGSNSGFLHCRQILTAEPSRKPKVKVKGAQSCPILCDLTDYTVHGILQARILEWVAVPFFRGSSQPRVWTQVSSIARGFFTSWATGEAQVSSSACSDTQSGPTLCDPMDCSPPGSSVHGILQARIMEWAAICYSRGSSAPRDRAHISYVSCTGRQILYTPVPPWKPPHLLGLP